VRQFNVASNAGYVKAIRRGEVPGTVEHLTPAERANEYIMTSLRTSWGCDTRYIEQTFGFNLLQLNHQFLERYHRQDLLKTRDNVITLTRKGKLLADRIASDLFVG
jgi:oxygen-independent coproporphyrinogen-3 oxidase